MLESLLFLWGLSAVLTIISLLLVTVLSCVQRDDALEKVYYYAKHILLWSSVGCCVGTGLCSILIYWGFNLKNENLQGLGYFIFLSAVCGIVALLSLLTVLPLAYMQRNEFLEKVYHLAKISLLWVSLLGCVGIGMCFSFILTKS